MTEEEKVNRRRIRLLMIDPELLHSLLQLPPEVTVIGNFQFDYETHSLILKIQSDHFDPVKELDIIPRVAAMYLNYPDDSVEFSHLTEYARECYSSTQIEYRFPAPARETLPGGITRGGAVERHEAAKPPVE